MSIERFEQDQVVQIGQPWHGAIQGTTLVTESGIETALSGAAPLYPDTQLVQFPGLPEPTTTEAELALGMKLKNYAILFDKERRYSPKAGISFGRNIHRYLTEDRTHYRITVVALTVSESLADGAAWNMPFALYAYKATGSGYDAGTTIVPARNLSITGIGGSAGYYGYISNFSPDGKRLCIAIHKYANSSDAEKGDRRRSLGCAGIWEIVLSGGSTSAAPTAVLTQIKTSADWFVASNPAASPADIYHFGDLATRTGSGQQSTNDEFGNPLPEGQLRVWGWHSIERKVFDEVVDTSPLGEVEYWNLTRYSEVLIGASYGTDNVLKIVTFREDYVATSSNHLVGPVGVVTLNYDAIITGPGGTVVRWIDRSDNIVESRSLSRTVTQTFSLRLNGVPALEKTISRSYTLEEASEWGYIDWVEWSEVITTPLTEIYSKTLDGSATTLTTLTYRITGNQTAALFGAGLYALGFCAPSGSVGSAQTLTLDGDGWPWAAWNPKSDAIATTPGWSWC